MDENRKIVHPITFNESLINNDFVYFNIYGEPFAKQRPRATKKGRYITIYTPRETKLYENKVKTAYNKIYSSKQLKGDLTVEIEGIFSVPKSIPNKKAKQMLNGEIPHIKKPDCDNMAKVCLDALNGVAYMDDAQINTLNIYKHYGEEPMIKITIYKNKKENK